MSAKRTLQRNLNAVPAASARERTIDELSGFDLHVTSVRVQCEIDVLNKETGKIENRVLTDAHVIYESAFFPGLVDYLREKGLGRGLPPAEAKDDPAKAVR